MVELFRVIVCVCPDPQQHPLETMPPKRINDAFRLVREKSHIPNRHQIVKKCDAHEMGTTDRAADSITI